MNGAALVRPAAALFCGLLLFCSCASTRHPPATPSQASCAARGVWAGSLPIEGNGLDETIHRDTLELKLVVTDAAATVYSKERSGWVEVMPGRFTLRCGGPSAVMAAIDSDKDKDGTWYETWVVAMTVIDADRALMRWVRMVNNVDLPLTRPSSRFSYQGVGVLQAVRTQSGPARKMATIGDLLAALCDDGDREACRTLADAMEKSDPARAVELRKRACSLGDRQSCEAAR